MTWLQKYQALVCIQCCVFSTYYIIGWGPDAESRHHLCGYVIAVNDIHLLGIIISIMALGVWRSVRVAMNCFRADSLVNIVVHLLLISFYSAGMVNNVQVVIKPKYHNFTSASLSEDFLGPTDSTGQIDFSVGTACACPGSSVEYLCTVSDPSGISFTRWRGTAFDCTGNQAGLFHDQYTSGLAAIACDNGNFTLTAHGLTNVTDDRYTSVLTVNVEPGLNGRIVECTFAGSRTIGNDTLQVAGRVEGDSVVYSSFRTTLSPPTVPLPPPSTPQVVVPVPDQSFTVSWAPPTAECGNAVTYTYLSSLDGSCGECTNNMTSESSTMCRGWTAQGQSCSITARADNCAGMGNGSHPVVISFPCPTAPNITGGEVVFDQSRGSATVTVEWDPVVRV